MNNVIEAAGSKTNSPLAGFWHKLVATRPGLSPVFLRVGLAVMLWPHGAQKLLGWFGGYGFDATMGYFAQSGIPGPVGLLVVLGEFFAPFLLLSGFLTRFAAASVAVILAGAVLMVHLPNGFFMNWTGAQAGEGFEFHLLAISMALALVVGGGGSGSVDLKFSKPQV